MLAWLCVVLGLAWWWRQRSSALKKSNHSQPNAHSQAEHMVACTQCGVHLPRPESVQGRNGDYCSQLHLQQSEGA